MTIFLGRMAITAAGFGLAIGGAGVVAPVAADPVNGPSVQVFDLTCGDRTYPVVVNGRGQWAPAHDRTSNRVFIPTSFDGFHGQIIDADGNVVDEFHDPVVVAKGSSAKNPRATRATCVYSFEETFEDPEIAPGPLTFVGAGDVTGFLTPARR